MVCGEISLICGDNTNYSLLNSEAGIFQVIMVIVPLYPGLVKFEAGAMHSILHQGQHCISLAYIVQDYNYLFLILCRYSSV